MYRFIMFFVCFLFAFSIINGQIVINEYSAANYDTHTDNYGEYEDWVELYNPTTNDIDLSGWALSDKIRVLSYLFK